MGGLGVNTTVMPYGSLERRPSALDSIHKHVKMLDKK